MKLQYQTYWADPAQDDYHLSWIRRFYRDVYSATGVDLRDWPELYYNDNYRRLPRVKARWDPTNYFHHRQSVRLP